MIVFRKIVVLFIRFYQLAISPMFPSSCRFQPTCSHYAITAVERFGVLKGGFLAVKRIGRCHPWNEGGWDPVPEKNSESKNNSHSNEK